MAVGFGLIGYGSWGRYHARSIVEGRGAELLAISARSAESCQDAREAHGVDAYTDYRDLLARPDIEVVDVAVPSYLHAEMAVAALQAGKHLFLEKPMAVTVEECDAIIEAAAEVGRKLYVGHEMRLSPLWGRAKQLIEEGGLGQLRYGMVDLWRNPYRLGTRGWRYDPARVGSWILEEPIHFYDLARWYMDGVGEPVSVYARANAREPRAERLYDNFTTMVNFPDDAYVVISQTLAAFEHHQSVKFTGTKGALWASWSGALDRDESATDQLKYFDGQVVRDVDLLQQTGEVYELTMEIEEMVRVVEQGTEPPVTGHDGREAVRLCLAGEESVRTGQVITL